jgi:16S rRNA (cytidine1402-2'-O)-methyltransferase
MGRRAESIVERIRAGEVIAYCTDAGMPGVSDPGLRLVRAAREAVPAIQIEVLPGPTAAATAYVASGCTDRAFFFGGFFPRKAGERRDLLERLRTLDAALIFYESPNRLADALAAIKEVLPSRQMAVCRELSKLHEEVARGTAAQLGALFAERAVKGEIVIVIEGPAAEERQADAQDALGRAEKRADELAAQGMRPKEIARALAAELGIARNDAYDMALAASGSAHRN